MKASYVFHLPTSAISVRAALKVVRDIEPKSFLAIVVFPGHRAGGHDVPSGLSWSEPIGQFFQYLPRASSDTVACLQEFAVPEGATKVEIQIKPWSSAAAASPDAVSNMVLETHHEDRAMLILPEKE